VRLRHTRSDVAVGALASYCRPARQAVNGWQIRSVLAVASRTIKSVLASHTVVKAHTVSDVKVGGATVNSVGTRAHADTGKHAVCPGCGWY
jgi:hypothetical protein